jgi:hypothetical protein
MGAEPLRLANRLRRKSQKPGPEARSAMQNVQKAALNHAFPLLPRIAERSRGSAKKFANLVKLMVPQERFAPDPSLRML